MYQTNQITDQSYEDIQSLYFLSFGAHFSLDYVKLKYNTGRFGLKNMGILAKSEEGELAAYYGVFPITLSFGNEDYLIAQSGDTMTAPKHRKKGLFTRLAKETYALSETAGIKMVFGFPNENSFPGFKHKLDWQFYGFMQRFTVTVGALPLCELSAKFPKLKPMYDKFVKNRVSKYRISSDKIDFAAFDYSKVEGRIKKDQNFFDYKLKDDNAYVIQIDEFQLLIKAETHLIIGEVAKIEAHQAKALMACVTKLARRLACKKVIFTLSENHWLFEILAKENAPTESLPIGFYIIDKSINPAEIQFSNADYDTF